VMGNSLALYNPPTRVAEEFAMIDCISGGRLIAGFPVGTPMDTCFAYGQNPSMLRERYYEAHDLVLRAWTEQDTFAFNGRFNQQRYVNIWPRPVQRPHPPIVFGGKTPHAFSRTARLGDGWFGYGLSLEAATQCIEGIRRACAEHGRRFEEIEISVTPKENPGRDLARRYAELGVNRIVVAPRARDSGEFVRAIDEAARELIGQV
jgi:alkanesulfonate monooxygenase SsuD/methylene tetrahydromethanopterin reductase-like flavin-dependent oxidoreductase (luciferase family)